MGFFSFFNRVLSPIFGGQSKIGQIAQSVARTTTGGADTLSGVFNNAVLKGGAIAGLNEAVTKGGQYLNEVVDKANAAVSLLVLGGVVWEIFGR